MEIIMMMISFIFVFFVFFILAKGIAIIITGILLIIILPFALLFDGFNIVKKKLKKTIDKRTKKVKKDLRDESIVIRVSKADLRDKFVHRPTVLRRRQ